MTSPWLVGALFFCALTLLILAVGAVAMWRQLERERAAQRAQTAELMTLRQRTAELTAAASSPPLPNALSVTAETGVAEARALPSQTEQDEQASFSYTVSHDLRAPIRVVEGFTKIVKEDYGRVMDRIGNDHLDRVLAAAARMNSMIDALLALSQLSTQPLAQQPVNLSQLANFVADDLRRQSPERVVTLQIEPGLLAHGDPTLLRMVLENLIGNAWKYTGKCAQPMVVFERGEPAPHSAAGPVHTFTVRDNGAGFDMRFSDRLFGVFQRLHSVNDFPGTGVGLASVRRIVRRHGGEIWADAEVDKGAAFHFSLRA
jgi:light-regulated signal transduction histidine kinase (bacteriophytochrome)